MANLLGVLLEMDSLAALPLDWPVAGALVASILRLTPAIAALWFMVSIGGVESVQARWKLRGRRVGGNEERSFKARV